MKINLYDLTLSETEDFFISLGEKKFRAKQVFKWIFGKKVSSFGEMSDISVSLQKTLKKSACFILPEIVNKSISEESGTIKYLLRLIDGEHVETVFIPKEKRRTICVSSQAGCPLGCSFCATGSMGFRRNLTAGEITGQYLSVCRDTGENPSNIVVMGMGEPFLNYDNIVKAVNIFSDDNGISLAPRRITVSTIGIVPAIKKFTDDGINTILAVSLNAATEEVRNKIMPGVKKYPIKELIGAVRYYTSKSKKKVTFEYVLLKGINDKEEDAHKLGKLLRNVRCKINLIPYNSTGTVFKKPSKDKIESFQSILKKYNIQTNIRWSEGEDIHAACGQLYHGTVK